MEIPPKNRKMNIEQELRDLLEAFKQVRDETLYDIWRKENA